MTPLDASSVRATAAAAATPWSVFLVFAKVTPGPLFTTATFVGCLVNGSRGAAAATAGILLPAFVFVALSGRLIPKLRASRRAGAFLDGVNVASLALMAVVTIQLGRAALVDAPTVLLAAGSAVLLVEWKVSSAGLIVGGAAAGLAVSGLRGGQRSPARSLLPSPPGFVAFAEMASFARRAIVNIYRTAHADDDCFAAAGASLAFDEP